MSTPFRLRPYQKIALEKLRSDMRLLGVSDPVLLSSGELGFKIAPRQRVCLSCGAKPNADGTIPCGH